MFGHAPGPGCAHHDGSALYVDDPAPARGGHVELRLRVPHDSAADTVSVRTVVDGEPQYVAAEATDADSVETWWSAKLPVHHRRSPYRFLLQGGRVGYQWVNGSGTFGHDVPDRDDFSVTSDPLPPAWLPGSVVYQVFPDRFARSGELADRPEWAIPAAWDTAIDDDWRASTRQVFGGNLGGLVSRLDHLERLGVNTIYLTPFFPARSAHRYDATSFDEVDPLLGGDAALAELTTEAHRRNMKVIGDLTTNHSGRDHAWFEAAQADSTSTEARFYSFRHHPDDYVAWFDVPTLPKLDHRAPELSDRMITAPDSVVRRWLQPPFELDGWRIDVANMTGRLGDIDVNHDVARSVRTAMASVRDDLWLVAEHCHDASADLAGDGWQGTMAYTWFTRPVWSWLRGSRPIRSIGFPGETPRLPGQDVVASMRWLAAGVPWRSFVSSMTLLDSHDSARFASVVDDRASHVVGLAWLMTYPGVPTVFAGDEVGVTGVDGDRARAPFPWDETQWDQELFEAHRALIALRRNVEALGSGGLRYLDVGADSFTFLRETRDQSVLVHLGRSDHQSVRLPAAALRVASTNDLRPLFGTGRVEVADGVLTLPGDGPAANIWMIGP